MTVLNSNRRLEVDSVLRCQKCDVAVFKVFRRQLQQADGTLTPVYENVLWPVRPEITPPQHNERITCPDCRGELVRVAP